MSFKSRNIQVQKGSSLIAFHRTLLLLAVGVLFVTGVVTIFNTTSADVLDQARNQSTHQALVRQLLYAVFGCWIALGAWWTGYRTILRLSPILLGLATLGLLLVFVPGIGRAANGSRRWIAVAGLTLQPSEFVKYLLPAYFIHRFLQREALFETFFGFAKQVAILAVPVVLILIEPNHGPVGVIGLTLAMLFFLVGIRWIYWALPMVVLSVILGVLAMSTPYVTARLQVYLNPEADLQGRGHQPYQAKIAAGSGELFGKGPGESFQKLSYLPEAQNDYIAAIFAEEFGFTGMLVLILTYMLIAYIGCYIAATAPDREGCYLAVAITFLISFQAFMNLGVVSGLLPSTGLNLPLFSQGGSSLLANLLGLGMLLSIAEKRSYPLFGPSLVKH